MSPTSADSGSVCPLCGQDNRCGAHAGLPPSECWCMKETFPQEIFELVPPEERGKACICMDCLDRFKRQRST